MIFNLWELQEENEPDLESGGVLSYIQTSSFIPLYYDLLAQPYPFNIYICDCSCNRNSHVREVLCRPLLHA